MKNEKAPGDDGIITELLKAGEEATVKKLKEIFNLAQDKEAIPEKWKNALIILNYKKGDKKEIGNFHIFKLYIELSKTE